MKFVSFPIDDSECSVSVNPAAVESLRPDGGTRTKINFTSGETVLVKEGRAEVERLLVAAAAPEPAAAPKEA